MIVASRRLQEATGKGAGKLRAAKVEHPPVKGRPLIGRERHAPGGQLLRDDVRACVSAVTSEYV